MAETDSPLAWPLPLAALAVSLWVTAVSYLGLVAVLSFVWITTPNNPVDFGANLQAALFAYLHVHVLPVTFAGITISIAPLLATLLLVWLIQAAARWSIRSVIFYHPASALGLILGIGLVHGSTIAGLSLLTGNAVSTTRAFLAGLVLGLLGAFWAVLASAKEPIIEVPMPKMEVGERTKSWLKPQSPNQLIVGLWNSSADWLRISFKMALQFASWILIFGFIAFLVLLCIRADEMNALIGLLSTDTLSFIVLYLWSILYLPVILGWVMVLLLGQSVTLGLGSSISIFYQAVAPLPVVPVLGLVPPVLPEHAEILLIFPIVAGLFVTRNVFKPWLQMPINWKLVLKIGFALAISTFVLFLPLGLLTQGSIGAARFEVMGAEIVKPALAAMAFVFVGYILQVVIWFGKSAKSIESLDTE